MALILPIMGAVFASFLLVGIALPVLPIHLSGDLGFGPFVVGLVTGSQFIASVLSRVWAGRLADRRGGKDAILLGLAVSGLAGLLYLLSLTVLTTPPLSAGILLFGRAGIGIAESLVITGAVTWAMSVSGPAHSGRVIAWIGTAMFGAMALGAPLGTVIYEASGFVGISLSTVLISVAVALAIMPLGYSKPAPAKDGRTLFSVLGGVCVPGVAAALSSLGYGAILAFGTLLFVQNGWTPVWLPFSAYAAALIAARLLLGQLPDRLGGARVAAIFVVVEMVGLIMIWAAPGPLVAAAGCVVVGFGYSLVYPGLGAVAVGRVDAAARGLAMGLYTVFLDIALGFGSVGLGILAASSSVSVVFVTTAGMVLCALPIAVGLTRVSNHSRQ
ncbi:arabinose transporter [Aminobacter sp. BA135]|uniref:arabinose transporter n=1 Tax=Aminobacter sp. BA135 TaxID=537596 RepID=UPI003D796896